MSVEKDNPNSFFCPYARDGIYSQTTKPYVRCDLGMGRCPYETYFIWTREYLTPEYDNCPIYRKNSITDQTGSSEKENPKPVEFFDEQYLNEGYYR